MEYEDLQGFRCQLSFKPGAFQIPSRHVLVIGKYAGQWLLTEHRERGLEFPGGKAEPGESLFEAAKREVYEETGGVIGNLEWFAEYLVESDSPFCKTVFTGTVSALDEIRLMETNGAVLVDQLELDGDFSFLMKDDGMREIIKQVILNGKWED